MSHFTVMVIGDDYEKQLAPYHEFECTGQVDEFVVDVDTTEENLEDYKNNTNTKYVSPTGEKFSAYDDKFYRDPTEEEAKKVGGGSGCCGGLSYISQDWKDGLGYRTKIHFFPEGFTKAEVPVSEDQGLAEWIADWTGSEIVYSDETPDLEGEHKYGYVLVDRATDAVLKVIRRTNPNSKWDWYQMGGRWSGYFKLKEALVLPGPTTARVEKFTNKFNFADGEVENFIKLYKENNEKFLTTIAKYNGHGEEIRLFIEALSKELDATPLMAYRKGTLGKPSLLGANREKYTGRADQICIQDIDFEAMRSDASKAASEEWHLVNDAMDLSKLEHKWADLAEEFMNKDAVMTRDEAIALYNGQKEVKEFEALDCSRKLGFMAKAEDYSMTEEKYIADARNSAISSYAIVKDSVWYAKGEMGWWGMSHDDKEQEDWNKQLNDMLDSLPEDTIITVVDCHI